MIVVLDASPVIDRAVDQQEVNLIAEEKGMAAHLISASGKSLTCNYME